MKASYFNAAPLPIDALSLEKEKKEVIPIIIALVVAIAPHVPGMPLWITFWCFVMWAYMLARLKTGWPLPSVPFRYFLTCVALFGLIATYRFRIGGDAFVGLMALMAAIKPFEMPTHRHKMITLLLTYFIIITSLFRSEALVIVLYMLFSVFVTTTALVRINMPGSSLAQCRRLSGTILAQAIPLMMILFLVFPRLPDSLFGLQDPISARTGFSDTLAPGNVTALAKDQTPAFWVEFDGKRPNPDQLYWRGIAFEEFDGRAWKPIAKTVAPLRQSPSTENDSLILQTILLAPHNSHWLMALDRPVKGPAWAVQRRDETLKSRKKINKKTRYKVMSQLFPDRLQSFDAKGPKAIQNKIMTGNGERNPNSRKLALRLNEYTGTTTEKVQNALDYFRQNRFTYSLTPPPLAGPDPIDRFLFDTRQGYCEHFASAFAFLLNGAGIPARVIGGYLGGELNPFGNYLIVRQSYAHAWVEYFDETKGWTRIDPTSAVAPERVLTNPDGSSVRTVPGNQTIPLFARMRFAMETLNLRWESWFTGYSSIEQGAWLKAMGLLKDSQTRGPVLILFTIIGVSLFTGILVWQFKKKPISSDPVTQIFDELTKKLGQAGLKRKTGQGPEEFKQFCMETRSDLADEIQPIMDLYISLRYKKTCPPDTLNQFESLVKQFKPKIKENA